MAGEGNPTDPAQAGSQMSEHVKWSGSCWTNEATIQTVLSLGFTSYFNLFEG